jgi:hypothetical protein
LEERDADFLEFLFACVDEFVPDVVRISDMLVHRSATDRSAEIAFLDFVAFVNAGFQCERLGGVMALTSDLFMDTDEFVVDAARLSDTLGSLTDLTYWSDEDAGLVQLYARQLEERSRGLVRLLWSADPNVREAQARLRN